MDLTCGLINIFRANNELQSGVPLKLFNFKEEKTMNNKLITAIGTAALVWAIYKVGEIKGSITTGLSFAKDPSKGPAVKEVLDEAKKGFEALDEGKKVQVHMDKEHFKVEVSNPEEGEEPAEEAEDQPED